MIIQVRSAYYQEGKGQEAWEMAIKLAAYVNEYYEETKVQLMSNFNGPLNQGRWVQSYESLAAMEEHAQKLAEDSKWQELNAEGEGLWPESGMVDTFFQTVP